MELSVLKHPDLVVALDIGSTYSGYAWQWRGNFERNRSNIEFNDNWGTTSPRLRKTKTCLLLDENKEVNSFGQLADHRFTLECGRGAESVREKWFFFEGFKLLLYSQDCHDLEKIQIDDHFGRVFPLMEVMSKFIGALRKHFLKMIEKKQQDVNHNKILWVVTVPAIWSEAAKKFMSLAAERCGLRRKNVLIALESEATAIHCIHLPNEERIAMGALGERGDRFLTVDLGGGTTDVLALHVRDDGMLEETSIGCGELIGGQNINHAFLQALSDAFDGNVWSKVQNESHDGELHDMANDFESKKVAIGLDSTSEEDLMLTMPDIFKSLLDKGEIHLKQNEVSSNLFSIIRGKFYMRSSYVRQSLFGETVQRVLGVLREILKREEVQVIHKIVLSGGFAESPIVVGKIKEFLQENFSDRALYVPTSPMSAVLSGAVLFGHDPFIFYSRICRATYGIEVIRQFDPKIHSHDKKFYDRETKRDWCKELLDIHVEKGNSVKLGEKLPSKRYYPLQKKQKIMNIPIYMSNIQHLPRPVYTTDERCKKLGQITVDMPDTKGGTSREVIVTMVYGGTELDVIAKDETTGEEYKATLRFDQF